MDGSGNVFVADTWQHRIEKFDNNGNYLAQFGNTQASQRRRHRGRRQRQRLRRGLLQQPIEKFDNNGNYLGQFGSGRQARPVG